jgi:site-specific recombinase XerD
MTLQEALEGWFLHLKADNASPRTLDRYQRVWRQFGTWLSERAVSEIGQLRAEHLRLYVLARLGEVSAVTAQYEVSPIKSFTSWLEEMEFLPRDPFRPVKKPKVERREMQVLRPDEVKRLLATFDQKKPDEFRDFVIVSLVLATGLRRSEVTSALLDDLAKDHRSLIVMGKGRKQRRVPTPADVATPLWRYVEHIRPRYVRTRHLFVTRRGGPIDPVVLTHRFAKYVRRAGIEGKATFHRLRHWAASTVLVNAMPLELVSRTLGHADSTITSRVYAHV